jgi:zinc/manganese transport system permease protein
MLTVIPAIASATGDVSLTWDLVADLQQLFAFHFMQNAFVAGTLIALIAGAIGYFMVLRGQSFAGHALANVGFAGAMGAVLAGWPPVIGLLLCGLGAAIGIDSLSGRLTQTRQGQDVAISIMQTFALGLGLLFFHLSTRHAAGIYATLFGTILGVSDRDVVLIALTATITLIGLILIARPLLFSSLDPDVASARGVPVRFLDRTFLILLAFAVAQAVQVVGILLIFALLVTPAAIAQALTARPIGGIGLSMLLALSFTWIGLAIAYFTPYPVGFFITSLAFGTYLLVLLLPSIWKWLCKSQRGAMT